MRTMNGKGGHSSPRAPPTTAVAPFTPWWKSFLSNFQKVSKLALQVDWVDLLCELGNVGPLYSWGYCWSSPFLKSKFGEDLKMRQRGEVERDMSEGECGIGRSEREWEKGLITIWRLATHGSYRGLYFCPGARSGYLFYLPAFIICILFCITNKPANVLK